MTEPEGLRGRLSPATVREATGRDWDGWLATLDAAGALDWDHRTAVAYLEGEHPEVSSWWRQAITVGYEQARGKRAVGETGAAGFEVGVQRTVAAPIETVWETLLSRPELWLGEGPVTFAPGERYEVGGASGEVRSVRPLDRVRMTWQPSGWPAPATVQITVSTSASGKTTLHAHVEKLPDAGARELMRDRWRRALESIAGALAG